MTLDGFASSTDLDLDCCRFPRHAFTLLPWAPLPPLLWKHDPDQIAGQIDSLAYDTDGNLN